MMKIYPHNTLLNVADHYRSIIKHKNDIENTEGITLDCYACLIFLAFSVEAIINLAGYEKIDCWEPCYERKPYKDKMKILSEELSFPINNEEEPYLTLNKLKDIRDEMAHGKPITKDIPTVRSKEDLHNIMRLYPEYAIPEYIESAYKQVLVFEKMICEKIGGCSHDNSGIVKLKQTLN